MSEIFRSHQTEVDLKHQFDDAEIVRKKGSHQTEVDLKQS